MFFQKIDKQHETNLDINRLTTIAGLFIRVLNTGLVSSILTLGLYGLAQGLISPGEFVAGITLAGGMAADAGWFVGVGRANSDIRHDQRCAFNCYGKTNR